MNFLFSFSRIKVRIFFTILCVLCIPRFDFKEGCSKRGGSHFFSLLASVLCPRKVHSEKEKKEYGVSNFPLEGGGGVRIFSSLFTPDFSLGKERVEGTKNIPSVRGSHDNFFIVRGFIAPMQARERRSRRKGKKVFFSGKRKGAKSASKKEKEWGRGGSSDGLGWDHNLFLVPPPLPPHRRKKERKSPPRTFKHLHHGARGAWC